MRICVFDTETGGVGAEAAQKFSIMQLGAVVWDSDPANWGGGIVPNTEFECVVNENHIVYEEEAMLVNGFTVERIRSEGIVPAQACMKFVLWLHKNFPVGEKITLLGHNVGYDVNFLQRLFRLGDVLPFYDDLFNYRTIDTASIARFLIECGLVPPQAHTSKGLFEHFGCEPTKPHDALSDAISTANLYSKLLELGKRAVITSLLPPVLSVDPEDPYVCRMPGGPTKRY